MALINIKHLYDVQILRPPTPSSQSVTFCQPLPPPRRVTSFVNALQANENEIGVKRARKNTFIKRGRIDFSVLKTHADLFIFRDGELVMIREH